MSKLLHGQGRRGGFSATYSGSRYAWLAHDLGGAVWRVEDVAAPTVPTVEATGISPIQTSDRWYSVSVSNQAIRW